MKWETVPRSIITRFRDPKSGEYIHPDQTRTISIREAARIQSFPDWFIFTGPNTDQYDQVGNAVPPLAGRAIGYALNKYLKDQKQSKSRPAFKESDKKAALKKLDDLVNSLSLGKINELSTKDFLEIWNSIHVIHPTLHPQNALEESIEFEGPSTGTSLVYAPFYKASGWPIALIPIAEEAFNRFYKSELSESEFYFNSF
jgi:DNA (cytosine-5)-methyltransferase 1